MKGGTIKIDWLPLVQALERFLVVRGYGSIWIDSEDDIYNWCSSHVIASEYFFYLFEQKPLKVSFQEKKTLKKNTIQKI